METNAIRKDNSRSSDNTLLVVGCGDLGQRVGALFYERGWSIHAVRRHPPAAETRFRWHAVDYTDHGSLDFAAGLQPAFVLACFNPAGRDVPGYRRGFTEAAANLLAGLGRHRVKRLIMVSSTRVYGERAGGWVDEKAPLSTADERALAIIGAERQILDSPQPAIVVRFGGIYGNANGRLVSRVAKGNIAPAEPVRYTNRIHREDCAGFLCHLLALARTGGELEDIYNGVDDEPAPAHEVERWLAAALNTEAEATSTTPAPVPGGHKRCRNQLLHTSGYQLRYPNYRAGYRQVLADAGG